MKIIVALALMLALEGAVAITIVGQISPIVQEQWADIVEATTP